MTKHAEGDGDRDMKGDDAEPRVVEPGFEIEIEQRDQVHLEGKMVPE